MPFRKKRRQQQAASGAVPRFRRAGCVSVAAALVVVLLFGALVWQQWPFLVRRFSTYPRRAEALAALERKRLPKLRDDGRSDLRGVFHAHSLLSHDSMGRPDEIVRGAQQAKIDFIFLTDHPATPPKDVPPELLPLFPSLMALRKSSWVNVKPL